MVIQNRSIKRSLPLEISYPSLGTPCPKRRKAVFDKVALMLAEYKSKNKKNVKLLKYTAIH